MATTLTIYEYPDADANLQQPIEPATTRTKSLAMSVFTQLQPGTKYVTVKATGGTCNIRISRDNAAGSLATTDDHYVPQNGEATFPVVRNAGGSSPVYVSAV